MNESFPPPEAMPMPMCHAHYTRTHARIKQTNKPHAGSHSSDGLHQSLSLLIHRPSPLRVFGDRLCPRPQRSTAGVRTPPTHAYLRVPRGRYYHPPQPNTSHARATATFFSPTNQTPSSPQNPRTAHCHAGATAHRPHPSATERAAAENSRSYPVSPSLSSTSPAPQQRRQQRLPPRL